MKQQIIQLKYSLSRAKALSHYLEKEGKTIEGELLGHIDTLYEAQVPEEVREYVASQTPEESREETSDKDQKADKQPRQSARKKQLQAENAGNSQGETGPVLAM